MSKEEKIKIIIQEVLGVDIIEITNDAHLKYDLGASDSQFLEIINRIETAFSTVLGFESFDMTVEDLLIVVFSEMSETGPKSRNKPRPVHYSFVYQVLPALAFMEGINLFWDLRMKKGHDFMQSSPVVPKPDQTDRPEKQGLDYLYDLWNKVSREYGKDEINPKFLDYEIIEKTNRLMILFHFPEPEAVGEAYYSLFVWNINVPVNEAASYFTLEMSKDNKTMIGQWMEAGTHTTLRSYPFVFTPRQFLDVVLKDLLPHEDRSVIDEKNEKSSNPQFLINGELEKEHIYLKIISAIAHKLNLTESQIDQTVSMRGLVKKDYIDIISEVYQMYDIDPKKHYLFIKQDVDRLVKCISEQNINTHLIVIRICQHFENRIAGDYDHPKALYLDYRAKVDLISQSPDFRILYNFISTTYPSFITDNANQKLI
ncbi:MAG: acyl carrier protein, partial [Bacteroidales bacterium]|nr:acyl carrier protein [Bacteroidales bacterium]